MAAVAGNRAARHSDLTRWSDAVTAALPRISTDRGAPHSGAFVGCPSAPYSIMEKMIAGTNGSPAG